MAEIKISAQLRPGKTKGYRHALRDRGKIPAVIYGKGISSEPVEIDVRELESVVRKKGRNALIDVVVRGRQKENKYVVMVKEIQREPIGGKIVHADLCKVSLKDKIHAAVPVVLKGESKGVKAGGIIQAGVRELDVECMPAQIPESIPVDISELDIGGHLTVADLPEMPEYKILNEPDSVLVTIVAPRMAEQPETAGAAGPVVAPVEPRAEKHETDGEEAGAKGEGEI